MLPIWVKLIILGEIFSTLTLNNSHVSGPISMKLEFRALLGYARIISENRPPNPRDSKLTPKLSNEIKDLRTSIDIY